MKIRWKQGRGMPTFLKGGAMGIVDGVPVYAAGCTYPWRETEQAWYWDAARRDWFPVEPCLTLGRAYTNGVTLQDGLLILGGRKSTAEGRISLCDAWWLRRRDGKFYWTQLPAMNYPRAIPSIGVVGNKILAFGGGEWEKSQGGAFVTRHLTNYEILDLENLSTGWRDMGSLPFTPLVGSAFASVGQSTYVCGGYECWTENNTRQIKQYATAWRYDFTTDTWAQLADFPGTASGWCAVSYKDNVILLGGGITLELHGVKVPYRTNHILEPGTPRQRLIGTYSDLVFVYDIGADAYRLMENQLPIGTNDLRCTISGNTIYIAGGETVDAPLSNCIDAFMIGVIEE
ncbi:hypothetical protein FJZ31_30215 [Candidatus Poribacteria bacterium]|nr:hypothetical protein [Candidatus Poribacteria bacterium]